LRSRVDWFGKISQAPREKCRDGIRRLVQFLHHDDIRLSSSTMPFKSQAQRRKFAQLLVEGKISNETFEEWNRETGSTKLPERVRRKAKTKARQGRPRARKSAKKKARR
jgi:hypothetical protein